MHQLVPPPSLGPDRFLVVSEASVVLVSLELWANVSNPLNQPSTTVLLQAMGCPKLRSDLSGHLSW